MTPDAVETVETKAREGAEAAVAETRQAAQQAGSQARSTLRDQADRRSTEAGERVSAFAGDFRNAAEQLRNQGEDRPADAVERIADEGERLGNYLKQSDGDKLLSDAEQFARERPWAIAIGGFAIGLTLSRLLKASSTQRYDRASGGQTVHLSPPQRFESGAGELPASGAGAPGQRIAHEQPAMAGSSGRPGTGV